MALDPIPDADPVRGRRLILRARRAHYAAQRPERYNEVARPFLAQWQPGATDPIVAWEIAETQRLLKLRLVDRRRRAGVSRFTGSDALNAIEQSYTILLADVAAVEPGA